jgi:hyperosmotically inducible protein
MARAGSGGQRFSAGWPLLLAVPLVALLMSGCTAAVIGGAAVGGYYVGKDQRSAGQIADDAAVTAAVKARLIASSDVRALDVNVDTFESVVILKGTVANRDERSAAERLARATRGVKGVRNELTVKRR